MKRRLVRICTLACCLFSLFAVLNVTAETESRFFRVIGPEEVELKLVDVDGTLQWSNTTAGVTCQVQSVTSLTAGEWKDYAQVETTGTDVSMKLVEKNLPHWMSFVPGGTFAMGDPNAEGADCELPRHNVKLDAFWVGECETPFAFWTAVRDWALTNGYDMAVGSAGAGEYPVVNVNWFDSIKWCNALSEMQGLTPCYYTDEALTTVCRTGEVASHFDELTNHYFTDWDADGYRLPTEAEWECAARGGLRGQRFPWGDTITHDQANYNSTAVLAYDVSVTRDAHPEADAAACEVYHFAENGYDACGFSGNVSEWCWDWFDEGFEACSNCSYTGSGPCVCGDGQGDDPCSCGDGNIDCIDCGGIGYGPDACSDTSCIDGYYDCSYCEGGTETCTDCSGTGQIECSACGGIPVQSCSTCYGSGQIEQPCMTCNGSGFDPCPFCFGGGCSFCGGTGNLMEPCFFCGGAGCPDCGYSGFIGGPYECMTCWGTGWSFDSCYDCDGTGEQTCDSCYGSGTEDCMICGASGEVNCAICGGSGLAGECPTCDATELDPCPVCSKSGNITCPVCEGDALYCSICLGTAIGPCSVCNGGAPWDMEYYSHGPDTSPCGEIYGIQRVTRGGNATDMAIDCRVSARRAHDPALRSEEIGFRVVRKP